jgi:NAD(P) transhydrogenase
VALREVLKSAESQTSSLKPPGVPYSDLTVGVPREIFPSERRVSVTPQGVATLLKKGFKAVHVASGAGAEASFRDEDYVAAGAVIGGAAGGKDQNPYQADIVLKVRPPLLDRGEVDRLKEGSTVISFLYPAQNKELVEELQQRGITSFGGCHFSIPLCKLRIHHGCRPL